jgi:hypothetical protein
MKLHFLFDWFDFGFMFRIYKNLDDNIIVDIQFLWFNIWIETFKR